MTFQDLGLEEEFLKAVNDLGFENPSEIQEKAIPILLSGEQDFVGLAQTGTGKTAAFGLPMVQLIDGSAKEVQGLIISPTRELCVQICKDLEAFTKHSKSISAVPVYGGASIDTQIRKIKKGAQIVVATPGRLIDLIKRRAVKLGTVRTVVLDEADEMLNMGFKEDIDTILEQTPKKKLVWLFSATMPKEVRRIASNYMTDPVEVTVGNKNTAAANIEHHYYVVKERDRYTALKRLLDYYPEIFGLIFCRTKRDTAKIADKLGKEGYNAVPLHGDLSQAQRDTAMGKFRDRTAKILVATDVAARGIDVDEITHVIHYNLPDEVENYTHRSGRTARAGRSGISISLINSKEGRKIKQIEKIIGAPMARKEVPGPNEICSKQLMALIDRVVETEVKEDELESFLPIIIKKLEGFTAEEVIIKFVATEFNKFLDYYRHAGDINVSGNLKEGGTNNKMNRNVDGNTSRFFINLGKKQNMNAGALVRLVCENTGLQSKEIGRIDIKGGFSFFEVNEKQEDRVLKSMQKVTYEKRDGSVELADKKGGGKGNKKKRKAKRRRN